MLWPRATSIVLPVIVFPSPHPLSALIPQSAPRPYPGHALLNNLAPHCDRTAVQTNEKG